MSKTIQQLQAWANARVAADMLERSKKPTLKKSVLLGTFESSSSKGLLYKVYSHGSGNIQCNCPGFT
jgi:hypothetical protein